MKSLFFKEQHPFTLEALREGLGVKLPDAQGFVKRMLLAGLAEHYREDRPDDWQDEALHGEYITGGINGEARFKFTYVGVVEIDGYVLICFPKYIALPDGEEKVCSEATRKKLRKSLRKVFSAIEHYKSEHTNLALAREDFSQNVTNRIAVALRIIRDYFYHGLYSSQRDELTLHGNGDIDWESTINTAMPVIQNNRPYYFEYFTNDLVQDDTDYITRLHSCIISECSKYLEECELAEILKLDTPTPYIGERADFGSKEYICHRLQRELNFQYVTQKQSLLRNMLAWVGDGFCSTETSGIQLFGTNSFHTLWEKMCAKVFVSQYKTPIGELGIELKGDFSGRGETTLESLIKKPQWAALGADKRGADRTLKPDYVSVICTAEKENFFVILDAKYYVIELTDKAVQGQPGVEDVCKQYLYQIAYTRFIDVHKLKVVNAFVTPADGSESSLMGTVSMPLFSYVERKDFKLSPILVFRLSAEKLMDRYIANKTWSLEDGLKELFTYRYDDRRLAQPEHSPDPVE